MAEKISIIECGGTASKLYGGSGGDHGYNFVVADGVFRRFMDKFAAAPAEFFLEIDADVTSVCAKDSQDMSEMDRVDIRIAVDQRVSTSLFTERSFLGVNTRTADAAVRCIVARSR